MNGLVFMEDMSNECTICFYFPVFIIPVTANPVLKNVHHKNSCPTVMAIMQIYVFLLYRTEY